MDPFGYEKGDSVPMDMAHLVSPGDYIATFMIWLSNVVSGGGIEFIAPMQEVLNPVKRSAVFWINLSSSLDVAGADYILCIGEVSQLKLTI